MKNNDKNTIYRNCVDEKDGDCPYMYMNEFGTECCSIDKIIQVKFYGCIPQHVLDKVEEKSNQQMQPKANNCG